MFPLKISSLTALLLGVFALGAQAVDTTTATLFLPSAVLGTGWSYPTASIGSIVGVSGCDATYVVQARTGVHQVPITLQHDQNKYTYSINYRDVSTTISLSATCTAQASNSASCVRDATIVTLDVDVKKTKIKGKTSRRTVTSTKTSTTHDRPLVTGAAVTAGVARVVATASQAGLVSATKTCTGNLLGGLTPRNAAGPRATGGVRYEVVVAQVVVAIGGAMAL